MGLVLLALFSHGPGEFDQFGHFEAHFVFDDFDQGDVGGTEVAHVSHEGTTYSPATGVELAHAPGYQINQNVGVANLLQCLFRQFSVQCVFQILESSTIE